MKSLIINKEINVNDINIKAGEIAEIQPDGSYKTKSGITIPSYIDIDNKKNFTKVVAMFSIGDFVVVNTEVFTIPNYVGIDEKCDKWLEFSGNHFDSEEEALTAKTKIINEYKKKKS